MENVIQLARLRLLLLLRQKLGIVSFCVGIALVLLSYLFAQVSFVNPQKIFWDFSLAGIFVAQLTLAIFLGNQLFHEEANRRTLHLVLSAGVSRTQWLLGNTLGITVVLAIMNLFWSILAFAVNAALFDTIDSVLGPWMIIQNQLFLSLTVTIVLLMGLLLSLIVKPILALAATSSAVIFVYSTDSIRRIFTDPESGRFIEERGIHWVLWLSKVMPPINWFDLKDLVSYEPALPLATFGWLLLTGLIWIFILSYATIIVFDWKDL